MTGWLLLGVVVGALIVVWAALSALADTVERRLSRHIDLAVSQARHPSNCRVVRGAGFDITTIEPTPPGRSL